MYLTVSTQTIKVLFIVVADHQEAAHFNHQSQTHNELASHIIIKHNITSLNIYKEQPLSRSGGLLIKTQTPSPVRVKGYKIISLHSRQS